MSMLPQPTTPSADHCTDLCRITPDRRRYKRVELNLLGRFMRASKNEFPCRLIDVSVGGAALSSPVTVEDNEQMGDYFDHLGGLEGKIVALDTPEKLKRAHGTRSIRVEYDDGRSEECTAIDVSISGASLKSKTRPVLGCKLTVGKLRAEVVRHHERGFGVAFTGIQKAEAIRKYFD